MSSIRSVLIRSSMKNIQKEISQLENWLLTFHDEPAPQVSAAPNNTSNTDLSSISALIHSINNRLSIQESTLKSICDRLSILESIKEIHFQPSNTSWNIDACVGNGCIGNEIIDTLNEYDNVSESVYNILKCDKDSTSTSTSTSSGSSVTEKCGSVIKTPLIVPNVPDDNTYIPDIEEGIHAQPVYNEEDVKEEIEVEEGGEEEVEVEEVEEEEVEEEEVEEEEVEEEEVEEEEVDEEVEEDVEEEEVEEVSYEEMQFNGKTYYIDPEGYAYTMVNDEISENPIGYLNVNKGEVKFFKTK
jgi:hypothetical protein